MCKKVDRRVDRGVDREVGCKSAPILNGHHVLNMSPHLNPATDARSFAHANSWEVVRHVVCDVIIRVVCHVLPPPPPNCVIASI